MIVTMPNATGQTDRQCHTLNFQSNSKISIPSMVPVGKPQFFTPACPTRFLFINTQVTDSNNTVFVHDQIFLEQNN